MRTRARERIKTRYGNLGLKLRRNGTVETEQVEKAMLWVEEVMDTEVLEENTEDSEDEKRDG